MCDDASAESSSGAEVSDLSGESSTFEATENDELVENAEEKNTEEQMDYSGDLVNSDKTETDTELCDKSPPNIESQDTEEAADNIEAEDTADTNESSYVNESSTQESVESQSSRAEIYENSEYSDEVNDMISSKDELEVYQKAELKEENIDGRTCLVRDDIDLDYVDPKSGMTNQELMEKGRAPYDSKTGERIELHHIGQEYDSPLAELTADSEHGQYYSTLHTKETESWRNDEQKNNRYNNIDRPQHWKSRVKEH